MQPFSIQCETCAARLKVKHPSAIRQRLACPKCGNMVLVEAPEDWSDVGHSNSSVDGEGTGGDTRESVSPPRPTAGPNTGSAPASGQPETDPVGRQPDAQKIGAKSSGNTGNALPQPAEPLLPGERWTSTASRRKKKWLLLAAGSVAILALAVAVFFAILANRNNDADSRSIAAGQPSDHEPVASKNPKMPPVDPVVESDTNVQSQKQTDADEQQTSRKTDSHNGAESPQTEEPPTDSDSHTEAVAVPPPPTESGGNREAGADSNGDPSDNDQIDGSSIESSFDDLLRESDIAIGEMETNFGYLSDALDEAGASLYEFGQIAAVAERGRVGQKKYFVFQTDPLDPSNFENLNLPLAGMQYNNLSLLTILADFFEITGVPVTLDAERLNDAGFDFGYRTREFKVTETTFATVLQQICDQIGRETENPTRFELKYDGASPARITIAVSDPQPSIVLPLPPMETGNDRAGEEMVELIKNLTGPDSWNGDEQNRSIRMDGDGLVVKNDAETVALIRKLLVKWEQAAAVTAGELDRSVLLPTWGRSEAAREKLLEWSATDDTPILQFLAAIQHSTQVNIIVDWYRLQQAGWNPRVKVPADVDEASVGDLLDELTHSMGLAYRAVNENTFEITTVEKVNQQPQVEFFSCHEILKGKLDEKQLVDLVRNALRSTGQNLSAWRVVFEPGIQCFIAVGPQTLHRQINAILKRIEQL